MTRILCAIAVLLFASPAFAAARVPASQAEIGLSFVPVVRRTAPAVVTIFAKRIVAARRGALADNPFFDQFFRGFGQPAPRVQNSLGSGVILSASGLVVSNYHVVGEATEIRVVLKDRREFDAEVLLGDEESDLAVLRLIGAADLPMLEVRDSDELEVGELVLAIGNPFGVGQTVSGGLVSGLARAGLSIDNSRGYFIQTDAAINPGNSGGALVDMAGQLVGVNTAILSRSGGSNGIGFAIPSNLVARILEQAEAGKTSFTRPWAGVSGQAVDAGIAEGFGLSLPQGMVIASMHDQSPFRAAGLAPGDIILSVDGLEVNSPQEMLFRMTVRGIGRTAAVAYMRDGARLEADVAMMAAPETPARDTIVIAGETPLSGLEISNINPAVIAANDLAMDAKGVVVTGVGGMARRTGLQPGDILLEVNGSPVRETADLDKRTRALRRRWTILFLRDGRRQLIRFRV